jgi:hypothetical protein
MRTPIDEWEDAVKDTQRLANCTRREAEVMAPTLHFSTFQRMQRYRLENERKERTRQVQNLVREKMKAGADYESAFNLVKIENAALFDQMHAPATGSQRITLANQAPIQSASQDKSDRIQKLVREKMDQGLDYDTAFNLVSKENPGLFNNMHQPVTHVRSQSLERQQKAVENSQAKSRNIQCLVEEKMKQGSDHDLAFQCVRYEHPELFQASLENSLTAKTEQPPSGQYFAPTIWTTPTKVSATIGLPPDAGKENYSIYQAADRLIRTPQIAARIIAELSHYFQQSPHSPSTYRETMARLAKLKPALFESAKPAVSNVPVPSAKGKELEALYQQLGIPYTPKGFMVNDSDLRTFIAGKDVKMTPELAAQIYVELTHPDNGEGTQPFESVMGYFRREKPEIYGALKQADPLAQSLSSITRSY